MFQQLPGNNEETPDPSRKKQIPERYTRGRCYLSVPNYIQVIGRSFFTKTDKSRVFFLPIDKHPECWGTTEFSIMNKSNHSSEHVRPMLEAMARSIDAARAKRTAPTTTEWSGSSEGATSSNANFTIGNPVAENGKTKAQPRSPASSFFRDREEYRKAG